MSDVQQVYDECIKAIKIPLLIAILITPTRFALELAGIPDYAIFWIGLLWFTLAMGIYWGCRFKDVPNQVLVLFISLMVLSLISRIPVALAWWMDLRYQLGTHYGLYFTNFSQALLNQIGYGSVIQIVPSFLLGLVAMKITTKNAN